MNKFTKGLLAVGATLAMVIAPLTPAFAASYEVNTEFRLGSNEGDSRRTTNKYIILHETANPRATGRNEATFMKRNWRNAYTSHIVGDGMVYEVGQKGYMQYGGASYEANISSYAQIELQHTNDKELFKKNYKVYVSLARDLAKEAGIPLTLDTAYPQKGIKSHLWLTQNIAGDHTDPYAYLSKMGISKAQLAKDLANGVGGTVTPDPTPSKPDTSGKKSNDVIASEVIAGLWGNGSTRVSKLKAAGYDPVAIQKIVDKKLGKGESTPAPAPQSVKFYAEKATFTPYQARNVRSSASLASDKNITGVIPAGYGINYNAAGKDSQGNVWVRYQAYSGTRYMVVRQNGVAAGTFR